MRIESDEGASKPQRGCMTKPRVSAQRATLGHETPSNPNPNGVVYLWRLPCPNHLRRALKKSEVESDEKYILD